jgi:uncharacterized delta-60 repeat protein
MRRSPLTRFFAVSALGASCPNAVFAVLMVLLAACWTVDGQPQLDGDAAPSPWAPPSDAGAPTEEGGAMADAAARPCAPGALDPAFGQDGLAFGAAEGWYRSHTTDGSGHIYVEGPGGTESISVQRFSADGVRDQFYGRSGLLALRGPYEPFGQRGSARVAADAEGRIVVASAAVSLAEGRPVRVFVTRVLPEGVIDRTFNGTGFLELDFGGTSRLEALAQQADGKWLVAGSSRVGEQDRFALARLTANGALDSSFATGGIVVTAPEGGGILTGVAAESSGRLYAGGAVGPEATSTFVLARYTSAGALDTSFGDGGLLRMTELGLRPRAVFTLTPNARILVAGNAGGNLHLTQRLADGSVDGLFGQSGSRRFGKRRAFSLVFDREGRIVVGGESLPLNSFSAFVMRLRADGSVDDAFGKNGERFDRAGFHTIGMSLSEQPDGKLLLVGSSSQPDWQVSTLTMFRYCP